MRRAGERENGTEPDGIRGVREILEAGVLGKSRRQAELLRFLVTEALKGREDRLKAYTIAIEALGRGEDFDPATDSIVRVEVGRLRQSLERYAVGAPDGAIIIEIPKGRYVPIVSKKATSTAAKARVWGWPTVAMSLSVAILVVAMVGLFVSRETDGPPPQANAPSVEAPSTPPSPSPRVAVVPFLDTSDTDVGARMSYGMGIEVASMLHAFPWMTVYIDREGTASAEDTQDYRLVGSVSITGDTFMTVVRLMPPGGDTPIWTERFSGPLNVANLVQAQSDVAERIALEIGGRDRAVARAELARVGDVKTGALSAYSCVLAIHRYWRFFREAEHLAMRGCLEDATRTAPDYADAWAALAFIHLDEHRYGYNAIPGHVALESAREAAQRAWDLDPDAVLPAQALFTVHAIDGAHDEFLRIGHRILAKAPSNPDLRADFGTKMAVNFGLWDDGVSMVGEALERNPRPAPWYYIAPAFDAYLRGDPRSAIRLSERMNAPGFAPYQILRLVSFAALGDRTAMARQRESFARLGARDLESALIRLEAMTIEPRTHDILRSGLSFVYADMRAVDRPTTPRLRVETRGTSALDRSITAITTGVLSRFDLISVINTDSRSHVWPEDYRVDIDISQGAANKVHVTATVSHMKTGAVVTAVSFDLSTDGSGGVSAEERTVYETGVSFLGQARGPIIGDYARRGISTPVMNCVLLMSVYFDDQTDDAHRNAVECARRLLVDNPEEALLHSALAMMLREAYTDNRVTREERPLEVALGAARRATELAPSSARSHFIESGILYLLGDTERMIEIGRRAVALNPYDADIVGGVAARMAYAGRFEEALEMLEASTRLSPKPSRWRDHAYFLAHFGLGDMERAVSAASGLVGARDPLYVASQIIARHLAGRDDVREMIQLLDTLAPETRDDPGALYGRRNYDRDLAERLVSALRDAGV